MTEIVKIPRIALFNPDPEHQPAVLALFQRYEYSLRLVDTPEAVLALIDDEQDGFDALLLPSRLKSAQSTTAMCKKIRAQPRLFDSQIVALNLSADKITQQSMYQSGADLVLGAPFDPETMHLLLGSLGRTRRYLLKRIETLQHKIESEHSLLNAFDFVPDGLMIFSVDYKLKLINSAALKLLCIPEAPENSDLGRIVEQVVPWLKQHQSLLKTRYDVSAHKFVSEIEASLSCPGGELLRGHARIATLLGERGEIVNFVVKIKETAQVTHLAAAMAQMLRTRSLCLLSTAACIRLIESAYLGSKTSVLECTEGFLEGLPASAHLNSVLTRLLEFLDLSLSRQISLRVDVRHDAILAVRSTDLAQLLGHLILHGTEFIGSSGELSIQSDAPKPGEGVTLLVSATSHRPMARLSDPYLDALLEGNFAALIPGAEKDAKLALGLKAAQRIADQYRTVIEYRLSSESQLKMRIRLPAKVERPPAPPSE